MMEAVEAHQRDDDVMHLGVILAVVHKPLLRFMGDAVAILSHDHQVNVIAFPIGTREKEKIFFANVKTFFELLAKKVINFNS